MVVPDLKAHTPSLSLVRDLSDALQAEAVTYCHWKSNAFLDRSRTGENDLDLLVRRTDIDAFSAVVHGLGFKKALNPSGLLPSVEDYYGYDRPTDQIVHVHTHYQLVVGDDLTKNYRIPLEAAFLEMTIRDGELPVPIPELELILLVIRLTLKHSTWDARLVHRATIPVSAREEFDFLCARSEVRLLDALLAKHLPFVEPQAFRAAMGSLVRTSSKRARIRAGRPLVSQLAVCARRSRAADVRLKLWRRAVGTARARLPLEAPRKQLAGGGAIIALVGADGAGKSTCVDGLYSWLSKDFAVKKLHLGRPPHSGVTVIVRALVKLTLGLAVLGRRSSTRRRSPEARWRSRARALAGVATARDRYLTYRSARRRSGNGTLVICDRFPLPQLSLMDAPQVHHFTPAMSGGWLDRRLALLEQRYYRALTSPDVLVVLRVDPEIAVARKPEEPPDFVRARWREIWEVDWQAVPAHVVDASRSIPDVLAEVKAHVWSEL